MKKKAKDAPGPVQRCTTCGTAYPFAAFVNWRFGRLDTCKRCLNPKDEKKRWDKLFRDMEDRIVEARRIERERRRAMTQQHQLQAGRDKPKFKPNKRIRLSNPPDHHHHQTLSIRADQPSQQQFAPAGSPYLYSFPAGPTQSPLTNLLPPGSNLTQTAGQAIPPPPTGTQAGYPSSSFGAPPQQGRDPLLHVAQASLIPPAPPPVAQPPTDPMPWSMRVLSEPRRAQIWIKLHYFESSHSQTSQAEVYRHYIQSFPPLLDTSVDNPLPQPLPAVTLIKLVPTVFPSVKIGGRTQEYKFQSLARRHGVDIEAVWRGVEVGAKGEVAAEAVETTSKQRMYMRSGCQAVR